MRVIGGLLFLLGAAGTAWAVQASFGAHRPRDVMLALAAPIALVVALCGALLIFVPRFFS